MKYSSKAKILRDSSVYSSLNDDEIGELADLSIERIFMPKEFIFWDGDAPDWFYIVAEGKVRVLKHSSLGKEFIIAFFGPGEMFGVVAVFENKPYPASAQAVVETKVVGTRREGLLSFIANRPRVTSGIIGALGGRLNAVSDTLPARELNSALLGHRLWVMLSSRLGPNLSFTEQEIANMAGTSGEITIRVRDELNP